MGCFSSRKQKLIRNNTIVICDSVEENATKRVDDNDTNRITSSSVADTSRDRPRISAMLTSQSHLKLLNDLTEIPDVDEFDVIIPPDMERCELENAAFINSLENPKMFLQD